MASDASQPLLGGQSVDLEGQPSSQHREDDRSRSGKSSSAHPLQERFKDSIGILKSWSRDRSGGFGGLRSGRSRSSSRRRQRHFHREYYYCGNAENAEDGEDRYTSNYARLRAKTRLFLSSKWGHYLVLFMVAVDVACIFADFLIELRICELRERHQIPIDRRWGVAQEALGLIGLIFSCLFMLELIASVLSFGLGYFRSKFHVFDALVIVLAFIVDVALRGVVEELGSLVVVLRLWRVFKIMEEMGEVSAEMAERFEEELDDLRKENEVLKRKLRRYGDDANEEETRASDDDNVHDVE